MEADGVQHKMIRFAAVGDLLLCGGEAAVSQPFRQRISRDIGSLLSERDLRFGNLEHTLPGDGGHVPTEPRVVGTPEGVRAIAAAGFDLVTLANNHAFDSLDAGFLNVRALLDELGLRHFGAGMTLQEACAPAIVEIQGVRLAFLGAADRSSGPYRFASSDVSGIACLDVDRLTQQIGTLRGEVHHVVVSLHWGEERLAIPSPLQIEQAHRLVDAGASMILGHHPHVLQGLEFYRGAPIIYSLGDFLADDIPFTNGDVLRWNQTERTGGILLADISAASVENVRLLPTYDSGMVVDFDRSGHGQRRIERTCRAIAKGVSAPRYRRERLRVKFLLPILAHLRWSELGKLRLRHVRRAFQLLFQLIRRDTSANGRD